MTDADAWLSGTLDTDLAATLLPSDCRHCGRLRQVLASLTERAREQAELLVRKTKPPPGHPGFHALLAEMGRLHGRKCADYGSDRDPFANVRSAAELGIEPWRGALVRMMDKVTRIKTFAVKGELANESFEDSLLDLASYSLICLVLYREQREVRRDDH